MAEMFLPQPNTIHQLHQIIYALETKYNLKLELQVGSERLVSD